MRENNKESKQRATLEYSVSFNSKTKKFYVKRVQSTTKYNGPIPETLLVALEILDNRIASIINNCNFDMSIKTTYKNNKGFIRNMKTVESENEHGWGTIIWDKEVHNEKNVQNNFDFLNF